MTRNLQKLFSTVAMAGLLGGCLGGTPAQPTGDTPPSPTTPLGSTGSTPTSPSDPTNPTNTSSDNPDQTFSHMDEGNIDPFQVLARIQEQGPPEVSTRMHSCQKMKYATLGNVLTGLGIDIVGGGATSAGGLYRNGAGALGRPDYANRIAEGVELSTAGAVRTYDIFVAAAPEIISGMPMLTRCQTAGVAASMFAANGACTMEGIRCLTGAQATQAQKDLCDSAVTSNTTDTVGTAATPPTVGQVVAVASLLAAVHSCE